MALFLLVTNLQGVSRMKLQRKMGINQKTAWHFVQRIQKGFAVSVTNKRMAGPVGANESLVGLRNGTSMRAGC